MKNERLFAQIVDYITISEWSCYINIMNSHYFEVTLNVDASRIEPVSALLADIGSTGVTVEQRTLDTFVAPSPDEPDRDGPLKAYFDDDWQEGQLREAIEGVCQQLAIETPVEITRLPTADWAESWKQNFPPLQVADQLLILPSWEEVPPDAPQRTLRLDPGMAFGTGTHETTALCLEQLVAAIQTDEVSAVLDVGTGSGILAMAAAILGVPRVIGCDIDPGACDVARQNCDTNGLSQVQITSTPLEALESNFDLVVANILAEENVRLANELVRRLSPGGRLILSGILVEKESLVREGFDGFSLDGPLSIRRGDWSCLVYRKCHP